MSEQNVRRRALLSIRIHGGAIDRVPPWWISTVGPIQEAFPQIELQIDWLGQSVEKNLDVGSVSRVLPLGDFHVGAKDAA